MRSDIRRWMVHWALNVTLLLCISCRAQDSEKNNKPGNVKEKFKSPFSSFSPRMDYEQWKPLGRGDPLKNDPTYDYVPPILDRVHYWVEPETRTSNSPSVDRHKTEVLLLGVTSKKPSSNGASVADSRKDSYDSFLKFIDAPKFNSPDRSSRPFANINNNYFLSFNRRPEHNSFSKNNEPKIPSTILVPPPVFKMKASTNIPLPLSMPNDSDTDSKQSLPYPTKTITFSETTTSSTTPFVSSTIKDSAVTIQQSNLIYQSSGPFSHLEWKLNPSINSISNNNKGSSLSLNALDHLNGNSNNIHNDSPFRKKLEPPEQFIKVAFNPPVINFSNKHLEEASSDQTANFVTPPPLEQVTAEVMHKGQVSDDNLDISNTYVKIGKTEAQVSPDASSPVFSEIINDVPLENMMMFPHMGGSLDSMPLSQFTIQTLEDMQTMQPPPKTPGSMFTTSPFIFSNEKTNVSPLMSTTHRSTLFTSSTETLPPETTTDVSVTTSTALTTDPLFKHYKQPVEPFKGPLYLIIQGHSKVKTYGPSKQIHGISVQESNDISENKYDPYNIKHLHFEPSKNNIILRKGKSQKLQSLKHVVQTGLGAISLFDIGVSPTILDRRNDIKETELKTGFKVLPANEVPSEKYHKGIVEAARHIKNLNNSAI